MDLFWRSAAESMLVRCVQNVFQVWSVMEWYVANNANDQREREQTLHYLTDLCPHSSNVFFCIRGPSEYTWGAETDFFSFAMISKHVLFLACYVDRSLLMHLIGSECVFWSLITLVVNSSVFLFVCPINLSRCSCAFLLHKNKLFYESLKTKPSFMQ